jgi:DNA-binding CsgD family transcriptional regulator
MTAPPLEVRPVEMQVLTLVAQGCTYTEIARRLHYSPGYVRQVLHRLYTRIGARSGAHAVALTIRSGQLSTEVTF